MYGKNFVQEGSKRIGAYLLEVRMHSAASLKRRSKLFIDITETDPNLKYKRPRRLQKSLPFSINLTKENSNKIIFQICTKWLLFTK